MFYRKDEKPVMPYRLFAGVLAVTVAFLFMFSVATPAVAALGKTSTISGEVIAVNPSAGTLTVKSQYGSSQGLFTFGIDKMSSITSCAQNKTLRDIGVGQDVTVTYHEEDGKLFADVVEKKLTLALACVYP